MCPRHYPVPEGEPEGSLMKANCCLACGEGGTLFCCDFCPASYHLACLENVIQFTGME